MKAQTIIVIGEPLFAFFSFSFLLTTLSTLPSTYCFFPNFHPQIFFSASEKTENIMLDIKTSFSHNQGFPPK